MQNKKKITWLDQLRHGQIGITMDRSTLNCQSDLPVCTLFMEELAYKGIIHPLLNQITDVLTISLKRKPKKHDNSMAAESFKHYSPMLQVFNSPTEYHT